MLCFQSSGVCHSSRRPEHLASLEEIKTRLFIKIFWTGGWRKWSKPQKSFNIPFFTGVWVRAVTGLPPQSSEAPSPTKHQHHSSQPPSIGTQIALLIKSTPLCFSLAWIIPLQRQQEKLWKEDWFILPAGPVLVWGTHGEESPSSRR